MQDLALYSEATQTPEGQTTLRLYAQPVKYRAGDGTLQPIDLTPQVETENGEPVYANRTNTASVVVRKSGRVTLESDGALLAIEPLYLQFDNPRGARIAFSKSRTLARIGASRKLRIEGAASGIDIDLEYEPRPGGVKEVIRLLSKPALPPAAGTVAVAWQTTLPSGAALQLGEEGIGAEIVRDGATWATLRPLVLTDAAGKRAVAPYAFGADGTLQAIIPSDFLRAADTVYPVDIDPYVQTGSPVYWVSLTNTSVTDFGKIFLRWNVPPELSGATISAAKVYATVFRWDPITPITATAYGPTTAWSTSDTGVTLNGMALGAPLASVYNVNSPGTKSWDVLGDESRGVLGQIAAGLTYFTVVLYKGSGGGSRKNTSDMGLGDADEQLDAFVLFDENPYIEFAYTGGGGGSGPVLRTGASVGVLMC